MKHLTTYCHFINKSLNETADNDKINNLQSRIRTLTDQLNHESDFDKKNKLQREIKICELKLMVARMEQQDSQKAA